MLRALKCDKDRNNGNDMGNNVILSADGPAKGSQSIKLDSQNIDDSHK